MEEETVEAPKAPIAERIWYEACRQSPNWHFNRRDRRAVAKRARASVAAVDAVLIGGQLRLTFEEGSEGVLVRTQDRRLAYRGGDHTKALYGLLRALEAAQAGEGVSERVSTPDEIRIEDLARDGVITEWEPDTTGRLRRCA